MSANVREEHSRKNVEEKVEALGQESSMSEVSSKETRIPRLN